MKAIILAAGQGSRLRPLTRDVAKCLLPIGTRTILEHQLEALAQNSIRDVFIVGGFKIEQIENLLKETDINVNPHIVYNPFYNQSNNLVSLWFAKHQITSDFLLLNGDVLFHPDILQPLLNNSSGICLMTSRKPVYDEEDMKVQIQNGRVIRVNKTMDVNNADCESVGILKFRGNESKELVKTLDSLVRHDENINRWFLVAIECLIEQEFNVTPVPTNGRPWIEIDTPSDYRKAIHRKSEFGLFAESPQEKTITHSR